MTDLHCAEGNLWSALHAILPYLLNMLMSGQALLFTTVSQSIDYKNMHFPKCLSPGLNLGPVDHFLDPVEHYLEKAAVIIKTVLF